MLALIFLASTFAQDPEPVALPTALAFEEGHSWSDIVTLDYYDAADDCRMTYRDRWDWKVVSVDAAGNAAFERKRTNLQVLMDGQPIPGGDVQSIGLVLTKRATIRQFPAGEVDPAIETRLARLLTVPLPPEQDSEAWTYRYPSTAEGKVPVMNLKLRRTGKNAVEVEVDETGGSVPMSGEGQATLDAQGMPSRLRLKVDNAVVPGSEGQRCVLTVTLDRTPRDNKDGSSGAAR